MPTVYSQTYLATPPGDLILEIMDGRRMAFLDFAEQMDLTFADSSRLLNGDIELTPDIAAQLEKVFEVSSRVWLDYERDYRREIEQANAENALADAKRRRPKLVRVPA